MSSLRSGRRRTPVELSATNTRATRSKSVESADLLNANVNNATRTTRKNQTELPTLIEDDTPEESDGRFSLSSAISGTTAISNQHTETQTLHDPEDLEVDDMVMSLPSLHSRSQDLIRLLAPEGSLDKVFTALQDPRSSTSRALDKTWARFESDKKDFGSGDYIRVDVVLRALFRVKSVTDITTFTNRPDALLYQANLATFANRIASVADDRDTDAAWDFLEVEDGLFPRYFIREDWVDDKLFVDTLQLGLEIRTQMAISVLGKLDENLGDLESRLESVFQNGADYRGWDGLDVSGPELSQLVEKMIASRMEYIRSTLHTADLKEASPLEELKKQFPWDKFLSQLLKWIRDRSIELEAMIKQQGGPEALKSALRGMLDGDNLEEDQAATQSQTGSADNSEPNLDAWAEFANENRNRLSGRGVSTQEERPRTRQDPRSDDEHGHSQVAIALSEKSRKERASRQKENRPVAPDQRNFIDPQKNAQRINFDDSQSSQAVVTTKSGFKRPRVSEDEDAEGEDDDEDEAFATDDRQIQTQAEERRRHAPLPKRPRREPSLESIRSESEPEQTRSRPAFSQQYSTARQLARKTNTGIATKRAWTEEEVEQLTKGIARYGHTKQRYADIKRWDEVNGSILEGRSVVNLKDKAINIVKAYRGANPNGALPPGFEHIPLGQFHAKQIRGYDWTTENTLQRRLPSEAEPEDGDEE